MQSPVCATLKIRSWPLTPRGREKDKSNTYKLNIQMHEKHIDQLSLPQAWWSQGCTGLKTHENQEQDKTSVTWKAS